MVEILGKIGFDWQVALANLVNFLIIVAILYFLVFKPLSKAITERKSKIAEGVAAAEANTELLEKTKDDSEAVLADARQEATAIISQAKVDATAKREELEAQTKAQVADMLESGKKSLEAEKQKMLSEARQDLGNLVVSATEKVVGKTAAGSVDTETVKDALKS